eukprot:6963667-Alexandrium_andersonii.AAC.1
MAQANRDRNNARTAGPPNRGPCLRRGARATLFPALPADAGKAGGGAAELCCDPKAEQRSYTPAVEVSD